MTTAVEWRPVPGWERLYDVSSDGQVRSLRTGSVLRPGVDSTGHPRVALHRDGARRDRGVHQLMAHAFLGPCPEGQIVRHLDDVPTHNVVTNIAYGTHGDNRRDCARNGTHNNGRKTECPLEHALTAPNLRASLAAEGRRSCLSCHRARAAVRGGHGLASDGASLRVVADRYFRKIMSTEGAAQPC